MKKLGTLIIIAFATAVSLSGHTTPITQVRQGWSIYVFTSA